MLIPSTSAPDFRYLSCNLALMKCIYLLMLSFWIRNLSLLSASASTNNPACTIASFASHFLVDVNHDIQIVTDLATQSTAHAPNNIRTAIKMDYNM